jgi:hypothetical protein
MATAYPSKINNISFVIKDKESSLERVPLLLFQEGYNNYNNQFSTSNKSIILGYQDQGGANTYLLLKVFDGNDVLLLERKITVATENTFLDKTGLVSVPFNVNLINNQSLLLKFSLTGIEDAAGTNPATYYVYSENSEEFVDVIVERYNRTNFRTAKIVKTFFKTLPNTRSFFRTANEIVTYFKTLANPRSFFKTGNELKNRFRTYPELNQSNIDLNLSFVLQNNCSNLQINNTSVYKNSTVRADYNFYVLAIINSIPTLITTNPTTTNTWNFSLVEGIQTVYLFGSPQQQPLNLSLENYEDYLNNTSIYFKEFTVVAACSILKCIEAANTKQIDLIEKDSFQVENDFIQYYALYNSAIIAASKNDKVLTKELFDILTLKCSLTYNCTQC